MTCPPFDPARRVVGSGHAGVDVGGGIAPRSRVRVLVAGGRLSLAISEAFALVQAWWLAGGGASRVRLRWRSSCPISRAALFAAICSAAGSVGCRYAGLRSSACPLPRSSGGRGCLCTRTSCSFGSRVVLSGCTGFFVRVLLFASVFSSCGAGSGGAVHSSLRSWDLTRGLSALRVCFPAYAWCRSTSSRLVCR